MLGIPLSTVRRYSKDFGPYLTKRARTKGHKRRYSEDDLLILQRVRQEYGNRKNKAEIESIISVIDKSTKPPEGFSLAMIPAFQEKLGTIDAVQRDHQQRLDDVDVWRSNWLTEYNAYNRKNALTRLWLRILGRAPAKPPGV